MQLEKNAHAINLQLVMANVEDDRELLAELAAMFIEDYPHLLMELKASIAQSDPSAVERIAHTLKGRLAFFGITQGTVQATELEDMGHSGELAGAPKTLDAMEKALEAVFLEFKILFQEQG